MIINCITCLIVLSVIAKKMAKIIDTYQEKNYTKRPGVHATSKTSNNKKSKLYKKKYRGQGR